MDEQTRARLRAAYILALLEVLNAQGKDHYFGRGQLKILEVGLRKRPIPLKETESGYNKLLDVVNSWFETNFVETFRMYIKAEELSVDQLRDSIEKTAEVPKGDRTHLIDNWLIEEFTNLGSDEVNKEIIQQLAKYLQ